VLGNFTQPGNRSNQSRSRELVRFLQIPRNSVVKRVPANGASGAAASERKASGQGRLVASADDDRPFNAARKAETTLVSAGLTARATT